MDNHFISFHFALSWLHFDFQFRVWKIFTKEKLPFEQSNYKVSSKRIDGCRSLFNVSNFVKRGIKILDILGLSNAVRQQRQNGAHDWVAHSTRKSQHTHTHTQSEIHLQMQIHMFVCLSICIYNYFVLPSGFFPRQRQR